MEELLVPRSRRVIPHHLCGRDGGPSLQAASPLVNLRTLELPSTVAMCLSAGSTMSGSQFLHSVCGQTEDRPALGWTRESVLVEVGP